MPTTLKGGVELRIALKQFAPDLAKETQKEIAGILKPITTKAKGFIPSSAPLSGWGKPSSGTWANRQWSTSEAKAGIGYKTTPSKPNSRGFRALARIVNASFSGSIYEIGGKNNPQGRPQAPAYEVRLRGHANYGKTIRSGNKDQSNSNNPNAGQQFVDALNSTGKIVDAYQRGQGQAGRASRKMRGRVIFRAWAEDGGKANTAVLKAIQTSATKLNDRAKVRG
jgi:hypothetical protein